MEKITKGVANIVVVGIWNKAILTPEWVKENLLNEYVSFEVAYPVNGLGSLKFTTPDFSFLVVDGRLQFELERYDSDSMKALSRTARKIFRLLGHTPISAMGVNFMYRDSGADIPSIFPSWDVAFIPSNINEFFNSVRQNDFSSLLRVRIQS